MIIGLAGYKGAGKDTVANHLWATEHFYHVKFATKFKAILNQIFDFEMTDWDNPEWKETPNKKAYGRTPRDLAQRLGTNWGRHMVHANIWVDATLRPVLEYQKTFSHSRTVISDVRFENEATAIREAGGHIFFIEKIGYVNTDPHESERPLVAKPGDVLLHGVDGDVQGLKDLATKVVNALRTQKMEALGR